MRQEMAAADQRVDPDVAAKSRQSQHRSDLSPHSAISIGFHSNQPVNPAETLPPQTCLALGCASTPPRAGPLPAGGERESSPRPENSARHVAKALQPRSLSPCHGERDRVKADLTNRHRSSAATVAIPASCG